MACQEPEELAETIAISRRDCRALHDVERERHGVTHAEVGAHLLALWGLPHAVAEAVARHHDPPGPDAPFDTVIATYVANVLVVQGESEARSDVAPEQLDTAYLQAAGLADRLPRWLELAERQFAGRR